MAFKLAIDDKVGVKVEGKTTNSDGSARPFKFTLVCDRFTQQQLTDAGADKDETTTHFFERVAHDWQRQDLVLDDDGKPAAFSLEALRALLSITGMAGLCWHSYLQQVQATAKN